MNNFILFHQQFLPQRKQHPKVKFSVDDDKKLKDLVEQFGEKNWNLIASKMETRNPRQCRERWENYLSPTVNKNPFTQEEDLLLLQKYNEIGAKWVAISKFFNSRTDISVKSRWMVLKRRGINVESLQESIKNKEKKTKEASEIENEHKERTDAIDKILKRLTEIAELEEAENWVFEKPEGVWSETTGY